MIWGKGGNTASNYGKGAVLLEEEDLLQAGDDQAEEISERLKATFHSPDYVPPVLPAAAVEVHRLTQTQDVKIEQILAALEKDPLLAARVVKVASSPVYGGKPLQSLSEAVMRLGMRHLGDVVWEVALNMRVFRSKAYEAPMEAVRRHSVACAHVARCIAKLTPVPLEYAFLCGLLHDVGAAAVPGVGDRLHLVSVARVDESHLVQGHAERGGPVLAGLEGSGPVVGEREVEEPVVSHPCAPPARVPSASATTCAWGAGEGRDRWRGARPPGGGRRSPAPVRPRGSGA